MAFQSTPSRALRLTRFIARMSIYAAPAAAALLTSTPAFAASVVFINEPFTGTTTTSPNWFLPSAPVGANSVCLTAGTAATPIPGCPAFDAAGSGALRLTSAAGDEEGGVDYSLAIPTIDGIDATFDSYQYGGSEADGIAFFLAAANPAQLSPLTAIGEPGGDLGYSGGSASGSGMTYGYLGFGLDVYGNFANATYEGTGCTDLGWMAQGEGWPNTVSVRGPGNGTTGYCMLNSTAPNGFPGALDGGPTGTRAGSKVPVEVVINPTGATIVTSSGLSVPAGTYLIAFTPLGGPQQKVTGALPTVTAGLGFPAGWINPSTGIPYQMTFGWVGSTGGSTDIHEVSNVTVGSANGTPPTLSATVTDNASGAPESGATMDYDVAVSNAAGATADPGPIFVSDVLPAGETPLTTGLGGSGWSCSVAGQTVSCTYNGALAPGASLPPLTIPVTVTANAGTVLTNIVTASSDDSFAGSGKDVVTVAKAPTSLTTAVFDASAGSAWTSKEVTGAQAYDTATFGAAGNETGTVTYTWYSDGNCSGSALGTSVVTVSAGTVPHSANSGALAAGSYTYKAVYSGDTNHGGSTGACEPFTVLQAVPSLATVVFDATTKAPWSGTESTGARAYDTSTVGGVAGFTPTGEVSYALFADDTCSGTPMSTSTVTLVGGTPPASANTILAEGSYGFKASYSGDVNYEPLTGGCEPFTVTAVSSSVGSAVYDATTNAPWSNSEITGAEAYDTATVTGVAGFTPTGTVTYSLYSGGACNGTALQTSTETLGGGVVPSSATSAALDAGTYSYVAAYSGDSNYDPATGSCRSFVVATAAASIASAVDDATTNAAWSGMEVTGAEAYDTSTVTGVTGFTPTGTVTYSLYSGGACAGAALQTSTEPLTGGIVPSSATSAALASGTYSYQATYSGDSNYNAKTSLCVSITVNLATPTVGTVVDDATLSGPWANNEATGASAYDTSTVGGVVAGFVPTGTVTYSFFTNGTCSGPAASLSPPETLSGGNVPNSPTTAALSEGAYGFMAAYSGDANYAAATGACESFNVSSAGNTVGSVVYDATTTSPWAGSEITGASAYDTATITPAGGAGGGFTPTGTVTYSLFANGTCTGTAVTSMQVTLGGGTAPQSSASSALGAGSYGYQAAYSGDANYQPSTGACEPFVVAKAAPTVATVVDDATQNSAWAATEVAGATAYDTATVTSVTGFPPTGTVTYSLFTNAACMGAASTTGAVTLAGGLVPQSATTAALAGGTYGFQAAYSGDGNYALASGPCETFVVAPGLTISPPTPTSPPRGSISFSAMGGIGTYTWAVNPNASGGSITSAGAYTAGPNGNTTDTVTVTDSANHSASTTVTVGPDVSISPSTPSAPPRGMIAFKASGGSGTGYAWTYSGASGGSIDATTGAYTAGPNANTVDKIGVTDSLGNTASVQVSVGSGLAINPPMPTVPPRGQVTFTATGGSGMGLVWTISSNASGGTISDGAYTAGSKANVMDVVTVTDSDGNTATAHVSVGPGVAITPPMATVPRLGTKTFAVSGGSGTGYTWKLSTNASGGSISNSGVYTAGPTGGVDDTIEVSDSLGNTATAQATVTGKGGGEDAGADASADAGSMRSSDAGRGNDGAANAQDSGTIEGGGCGCRTAGSEGGTTGAAWLAGLALGAAFVRRRRKSN